MVKVTYHTHTNSLGFFDGKNTVKEMITQAEELGFDEIGISNHLVCHPNFETISGLLNYSNDSDVVEDIYKKTIEEIREEAIKHKIKVRVGFEVDFFTDKIWRSFFERLRERLEADYYIGSCHYFSLPDVSKIFNMNDVRNRRAEYGEEMVDILSHHYWQAMCLAANSGYFDFLAHIDQLRSKGFCYERRWWDDKMQLVETLSKSKTAYELSTKGLRIDGCCYPVPELLVELCRRKVPVVISDDAHNVIQIGDNFEQAESLLQELNYTTRFYLSK